MLHVLVNLFYIIIYGFPTTRCCPKYIVDYYLIKLFKKKKKKKIKKKKILFITIKVATIMEAMTIIILMAKAMAWR